MNKEQFLTNNDKILSLFTQTGKPIPEHDSDTGKAVAILQTICDSQSHRIPQYEIDNDITFDENLADAEAEFSEFFDALDEIATNLGTSDFTLDFDGNEYRLIAESDIWEIYVDTIKEIVNDCYDLKLDKVPDFIALTIDWEQTAKNAYEDGYARTFSSYCGDMEKYVAGYCIFRTN